MCVRFMVMSMNLSSARSIRRMILFVTAGSVKPLRCGCVSCGFTKVGSNDSEHVDGAVVVLEFRRPRFRPNLQRSTRGHGASGCCCLLDRRPA